jgi:hypothetical protein
MTSNSRLSLLVGFGVLCVFFFGQMGLTYEAVEFATDTAVDEDGIEVIKGTNEAIHTQQLEQRVKISVTGMPPNTVAADANEPGAERAQIGTISRHALTMGIDNAEIASSKGVAEYTLGELHTLVEYTIEGFTPGTLEVTVTAGGNHYLASCAQGGENDCVITTFVLPMLETGDGKTETRALRSSVSHQALLDRSLTGSDTKGFERSLKEKEFEYKTNKLSREPTKFGVGDS